MSILLLSLHFAGYYITNKIEMCLYFNDLSTLLDIISPTKLKCDYPAMTYPLCWILYHQQNWNVIILQWPIHFAGYYITNKIECVYTLMTYPLCWILYHQQNWNVIILQWPIHFAGYYITNKIKICLSFHDLSALMDIISLTKLKCVYPFMTPLLWWNFIVKHNPLKRYEVLNIVVCHNRTQSHLKEHFICVSSSVFI